jgi:tetratricopeptide (TPR) repeat protein
MPTGNPLQPLALLGELLVLGAVVVCASWYRRRPGLVLTILLFGLSYALIANFLRIGTIFGERLFYWPSVFACLGIGALVAWLWAQVNRQSWRRVRPAAVVLALALAGLLSWRTVIRNPDWKSNQALALATALDNAQSAKALEWAGQVLVCSDRKDWYPTGEQLLLDAIKLHPNFASAYWELAKHYFRQERTSEGVIYLAQSAVQDRSSVQVRQAILATRDMLRDKQPAALQAQVEQWNRQHPDNPAGYLALSWTQRAQGHRTEAIASVRQSLTLDPTFQEAGAELGLLYLEAGDAPSAVRALRTYASYACNSPEAQCQLAFALLKLNPLEYPDALAEAEACMNKAEALDPVGHSTKLRQLRAEWLHLKTTLHAASRSEAGARSPA